MNKATLASLQESIAHWERLAAGTQGSDETPDSVSCSLCYRFNQDCETPGPNPEKCPVYLRTGRHDCLGSPWQDASRTWRFGPDLFPRHLTFRDAAIKELEFLRSLLPKEE